MRIQVSKTNPAIKKLFKPMLSAWRLGLSAGSHVPGEIGGREVTPRVHCVHLDIQHFGASARAHRSYSECRTKLDDLATSHFLS